MLTTWREVRTFVGMSNGVSTFKTVSELARVQSGHPFARRIEASENGAVAVLQMKDLPTGMHLHSGSLVRVDALEIKTRYQLKIGDVLFRSRGQRNTAVVLDADFGSMVAAAPLMALRVTSKSLLPEYLCWWINQLEAQAHFDRNARGTAGRMINRKAVEDLEISVPSLDTQKQIVEVAILAEREKVLMEKLVKKRAVLVSGILMKAAQV